MEPFQVRVDTPDDATSSRRRLLVVAVGVVAIVFVVGDLLRLANGGGIFSVGSAMTAVDARSSAIAVDGAGLRLLFFIACSLMVSPVGWLLDVDFRGHWAAAIVITSIITGGFILDGVYGPGIIRNYMARHGYSRCHSGDYDRGSGKGRVWFDAYALSPAACPG